MPISRASLVGKLETIISNLVVSIKATTKAIDLSYCEATRDSLLCASRLKVDEIIRQSKSTGRPTYSVAAMLASLHTLNVGSHSPVGKIGEETSQDRAATKTDKAT